MRRLLLAAVAAGRLALTGISVISAMELVPLTAPACAATITPVSVGNGSTVVYVVGQFNYGDENEFAQVTASLSRVFVSFHSPGGSAKAGMEIGRIIHRRGYPTYVGAGSVCGSACAVAWIGGQRRVASSQGRIAFHAVYLGSGADAHESGVGNALLGAYFAEIGLNSDRAIIYFTHAGPHDVQYLSFEDARQLGITVEQQEWQETAAVVETQPVYNSPSASAPQGGVSPVAKSYPRSQSDDDEPGYPPSYPAQQPLPFVLPPVVYPPAPVYRGPICCMPMQRPMMVPRVAPRAVYRR